MTGYYLTRVRCDNFKEQLEVVGSQYQGDSEVTNRMKRRIAKRQVLALYAGIVMGLRHLDEEQKKQ
eukprot:7783439-Alexandrium_andersonii.AAC.1